MNTAQARTAANTAAKALKWDEAASLYDLAVANYPRPYPKLGALAELDVAKLTASAASCRAMASQVQA